MKIKTDSILSKLGHLNDEQFKVLFFIYNSINMNSGDEHSTKIYRAVLADLCGKSERTISRITDKLAEQGLITKDSVSDGAKLYNYYSIPRQKTTSNLVTDDRVKELKESKVIKEIKKTKVLKENKKECNTLEEKKEFNIACGIEFDWNDELQLIESQLKECSSEIEMKNVGQRFEKLTKMYGEVPEECNEMLQKIKQVVDSKKCLIKA